MVTSKVDTIFVTTVEDFSQSDGPVPRFINRHTFVCTGYTSDFKNYIKLNPRESTHLIEIIPNYRPGPVRPYTNGIFFKINTKSFRLTYFVSFDTLKHTNVQTITVNSNTYDDVYELDVPFDSEFALKGNINKFYWSKTNGYLKLITDKKDQILLVQKTNSPAAVNLIRQSEKYKDKNWRK
jgi:hypothetical protein